MKLNVNGKDYEVAVDEKTPLVWVIREQLGLTGTKFCCGAGVCGSCTVLIDGELNRSCIVPVETAANSKIVTIEGLSPNNDHPVQQAWQELDVPQCGFCQSGQILCAAKLLEKNKNLTEDAINQKMNVICRCGTHGRIKKGIMRAKEILEESSK